MVADAQKDKLDALIARLAATEPAEARLRLLEEAMDLGSPWELAERLKIEADTVRYQDRARSLRWSDDIVALGQLAEAPTVVALGRMVEGMAATRQDPFLRR